MRTTVNYWSTGDGEAIPIARVHSMSDIAATLREMGLAPNRPVLVIVGGAGSLGEMEQRLLGPLFSEGLAPLAEALGAAVVDGGTDAGVMRLIGQARAETGATFPLIGVAPADKVLAPGEPESSGGTHLELRHTHIVLVPAASWASGVDWLAAVAEAYAGEARSVTVLIGGGDVTWIDAEASVKAGRPLVVVRGTGRVADTLAAFLDGESHDARAEAIASSGLLTAVDLMDGPAAVAAAVERALDERP